MVAWGRGMYNQAGVLAHMASGLDSTVWPSPPHMLVPMADTPSMDQSASSEPTTSLTAACAWCVVDNPNPHVDPRLDYVAWRAHRAYAHHKALEVITAACASVSADLLMAMHTHPDMTDDRSYPSPEILSRRMQMVGRAVLEVIGQFNAESTVAVALLAAMKTAAEQAREAGSVADWDAAMRQMAG